MLSFNVLYLLFINNLFSGFRNKIRVNRLLDDDGYYTDIKQDRRIVGVHVKTSAWCIEKLKKSHNV